MCHCFYFLLKTEELFCLLYLGRLSIQSLSYLLIWDNSLGLTLDCYSKPLILNNSEMQEKLIIIFALL